ncbi:MAG: hypothetical protein ACK4P3_09235 [Fimbriimonadaceae bacterium]
MRLAPIVLSLLAIGSIALVAAQEKPVSTTVAKISDSPKTFDNKKVTLSGTVAEFQQRTSRAGNDYVLFVLRDGGKSVKVYGFGKPNPPIKNGMKVEITGIYRVEKKQGDQVFKNEVDISPEREKPLVIKILSK